MREEEFTSKLVSTIIAKFVEIMAEKPTNAKFLNYVDALAISQSVRNVFIKKINSVPKSIEAALDNCEVIMSPEIKGIVKPMINLIGFEIVLGGIAMIIAGIVQALDRGVLTIAAKDNDIYISLIFIAGGVGLAVIAAGWMALYSDPIIKTERYIKTIRKVLTKAMPEVWKEFGDKLSND